MKKITLLVLVLYCTQLFSQSTPKVYLNFVSHNEDNYVYNSSTYPNTRDKLLKMAQLCQTKAVKWDMQSDYTLLQAVAAQDVGSITSNTGGLNVLKYIVQTYPNNVQCELHSHESKYNYPDLAYMMTTLGLDPGVVMGGLVYDHVMAGGTDWQSYQNPVAGKYYPQYVWAPEIIWGAGTLQHLDDPELYGVWKPNSMTDFFSHNANNHLISYGNGCRIEMNDTTSAATVLAIIKKAVNAIKNGTAPSNGFYCTSLFFEEASLFKSDFIDLMLPELMDSINNYVGKGEVEWLFIPEVIEKWKNDYASNPFTLDCDSLSVESSVDSIPTSTIVYCNSTGNTSSEFINSVSFGSSINNSGNNNGYGDFTSNPINVNPGVLYSLSVKPGFISKMQKEYFTIWIDYNQDGDFDDTGEEICKGISNGKPYKYSLTIPANTKSGNTRMRVSMKYGAYPSSCEAFSRGEVEDYVLTIASSAKTSNIEEMNLSNLSFTISPNPAKDDVTLHFSEPISPNSFIQLIDMQGREVYNSRISNSETTHVISLNKIPSGLYFIAMQSESGSTYQKLIISR